jgi:hypothetical protein
MATPLTLMRLAVSCTLAAAMLAACGGSQTSGSSVGTMPQAGGAASSQHSPISPADEGGGCGGDTRGGFGPSDGCGGGCGGDTRGGFHNNDGGEGGNCKAISVTPHRVFFTVSNPGPFTVTVKTRQTGAVSEQDTCGGSTGVATVVQVGTTDQWTVTAGPLQGSCKALFILKDTSGNKLGQAVLHITNFI